MLPSPHLHTLSSCVRRGYCIHNTASFISLHSTCRFRKLHRHTPFSSIHSSSILRLPPLIFLAVAPSPSHRGWLRCHFALNQGTPPKGGEFIVTPPLHAHIRYVSLRSFAQLPRLWWLLDCRNTATALLGKKNSVNSILFPAVLGGV